MIKNYVDLKKLKVKALIKFDFYISKTTKKKNLSIF